MTNKKNESELLVNLWEISYKQEKKRICSEFTVGKALEINLGHNFDYFARACKTCGLCLSEYYYDHHPYYTHVLHGSSVNPKRDPRTMFCTSVSGKRFKHLLFPDTEIEDQKLEKWLKSITHM